MTGLWARRLVTKLAGVAFLAAGAASASAPPERSEAFDWPAEVRRMQAKFGAESALPVDADSYARKLATAASEPLGRLIASTPDGFGFAVRVDGLRVFAATTYGIEIYDRSPGDHLVRLGGWPRAMGGLAVDARGRWAAGIDLDQRWFLIDVVDPAHPREVLSAPADSLLASDIAVGTTFVAIADATGTQLVSLLAGAPRLIGRIPALGPLRADGSRLLAGDGSLWRLLDPTRPLRLTAPQRSPIPPFQGDVDFENDIAVFTHPGEIWSYADSIRPRRLAVLPDEPRTVAIDGQRLHVGTWRNGDFYQQWSIATPANPKLLGESATAWLGGIDAVGNRLFRAGSVDWGIETMDVGDPKAPLALADTRAGADQFEKIDLGGRWLAGLRNGGELFLWDVSDPTSPVERPLPSFDLGGTAEQIEVAGDYLVLSRYSEPRSIVVVDLSTSPPFSFWKLSGYSGPKANGGFLVAKGAGSNPVEAFRLVAGSPPVSLGTFPDWLNWDWYWLAGSRVVVRRFDAIGWEAYVATFELAGGALVQTAEAPIATSQSMAFDGRILMMADSGCLLTCWFTLAPFDLSDSAKPVPLASSSVSDYIVEFAGARTFWEQAEINSWFFLSSLFSTRLDGGPPASVARVLSIGHEQFSVDATAGRMAAASMELVRFFDLSAWKHPAECERASRLHLWGPSACASSATEIARHVLVEPDDQCAAGWSRTWKLDGVIDAAQTGDRFVAPAGLSPGTHQLAVQATCGSSSVCPAVSESATFAIDTAPPAAVTDLSPTSLILTGAYQWADFAWSAASGARSYDLEYARAPFTDWALVAKGLTGTTAREFLWNPGGELRFRLRARNACGVTP